MMCVFCAGIPLATSIGMAVAYSDSQKKRETLRQGQVPSRPLVSPAKLTTTVVAALVIGAAIYHLAVGPRIGVY
jgi:hypothetical protein